MRSKYVIYLHTLETVISVLQPFLVPFFKLIDTHCIKNVRPRSYSGSHFPIFGLNTERSVRLWENKDQNNPEYGQFLRSNPLNIFPLHACYLHEI